MCSTWKRIKQCFTNSCKDSAIDKVRFWKLGKLFVSGKGIHLFYCALEIDLSQV